VEISRGRVPACIQAYFQRGSGEQLEASMSLTEVILSMEDLVASNGIIQTVRHFTITVG
jgi:hypothetical protein